MASESGGGGWGSFLDQLGCAAVIAAVTVAYGVYKWATAGFPKFWQ